jgi:hypothetical protein
MWSAKCWTIWTSAHYLEMRPSTNGEPKCSSRRCGKHYGCCGITCSPFWASWSRLRRQSMSQRRGSRLPMAPATRCGSRRCSSPSAAQSSCCWRCGGCSAGVAVAQRSMGGAANVQVLPRNCGRGHRCGTSTGSSRLGLIWPEVPGNTFLTLEKATNSLALKAEQP